MHTKDKISTDILACQMTFILIMNPFAAPVYLLGLVKDQMCSDIIAELDDIATKKIANLENILYEMFQLPNQMYSTSAGTPQIADKRETSLFNESCSNQHSRVSMSHLS